ncbi:Anti-sigma B factor antagonist RsbV [Desulfovibrio sp. TomC]|nr:Anti-sigma B factor antagonist RsbV [Desulfovibrio sp. TomC]
MILSGEIDFASAPAVRARLLAAMDCDAKEIVLHLADLAYIDSSGLALFIEARKLLAESGRTIRIADISGQVRKLFRLTQLGELFGLPE